MKKRLIILFALIFTSCFSGIAQQYAVNDIVPNVAPDTILQTQPISGIKVVFVEKKFTIKVSKADLINIFKTEVEESGADAETRFKIAIDYLLSTEDVTFKYIWSKDEDTDDLTWSEAEKSGAKKLTKKLIKESLCSLIDQGKFELFLGDKKENNFFFGHVDTKFGKHAQGVFTTTKRLIWVCQPWVICALPSF